jgi:putative membrane protein
MIDTVPKSSDALAVDRTRMAAERTLMAWLRTSLSMISFGFTIYKFLQLFQEQMTEPVLRPDAPRNAGLALVGIGTAALILACVQHRKYLRGLEPDHARAGLDLTFLVSCLVALLGVLMFGSILRAAGPFG